MSYSFYERNPEDIAEEPIFSDTLLLLRPAGSVGSDLADLGRFTLRFVNYRARGAGYADQRSYLEGVDLSNGFGGYPDFATLAALYQTPMLISVAAPGEFSQAYGGMGECNDFTVNPRVVETRSAVRVNYSDSRYRLGARAVLSGGGDSLKYVVSAAGRWGRDGAVEGVFSDGESFSLAVDKLFRGGSDLLLFAMAAPNESSYSGSSSREAFELMGDNMYNPYWGVHGDKVRSSAVRRSFVPLLLGRYNFMVGDDRVSITASAKAGERSVSGLTWFDATSPLADYYTKLPSYFAGSSVESYVAESWRSGAAGQIDWQHMYDVNSFGGGESTYLVDESVERLVEVQGVASVEHRFSSRLCGVLRGRVRSDRSRFFKRAKDLLGGEWIRNVDQYLIDDEIYGESYHNDMQAPERVVRVGDEFGYNYIMSSVGGSVGGELHFSDGRWRANVAGELGERSVKREGLYEKQTQPGNLSLGASKRLSATEYSLHGEATYAMGVNSALRVSLMTQEHMADYEDLYLSPESSNHLLGDVPLDRSMMAEVGATFRVGVVRLGVAAYCAMLRDGARVERYYDDLYSAYSDMVLHSAQRRHMGVEASAAVTISPRLTLDVAGALNSYQYANDPQIDIYADVDHAELLRGGETLLRGYVSSPSPTRVLTSRLRWSVAWGCSVSMDYSVVGGQYVDASPVRRTSHLLALSASPENLAQFTSQEQLPAASSVGLFLYKRFASGSIVTLSVKNLLNSSDVVYSGYETSRVVKRSNVAGTTFTPQVNKYRYSQPRTVFAAFTQEF